MIVKWMAASPAAAILALAPAVPPQAWPWQSSAAPRRAAARPAPSVAAASTIPFMPTLIRAMLGRGATTQRDAVAHRTLDAHPLD